MTIYKLGCRWDGKYPLFFDYLVQKEWVIGTTTKQYYQRDDLVLLTDGKTVLGLAKITGIPEPVTDHPEIETDFEKFQIDYDSWCTIASAEIHRLDVPDRFSYTPRIGMCHVNEPDARNTAIDLFSKYHKQKAIMDTIEILKLKNQIILQGPPGTGKTRLAKIIAAKMVSGKDVATNEEINRVLTDKAEQFRIVQFHPAYSYEDFVRGITAVPLGTAIEYKAVDKILAKFAADAANAEDNFISTRANWIKLEVDNYFAEVSRQIAVAPGNKFRIPGGMSEITQVRPQNFDYDVDGNPGTGYIHTKELLVNALLGNSLKNEIEKFSNLNYVHGHRHDGKFLFPLLRNIIEHLKRTQEFDKYFDAYQEKPFVLIIDEINRANLPSVLGELIYALEYRDEYVDSMYGIPKEGSTEVDTKIVLPSNLYIIGTMNTADRSVGHIDYAIRRRFAFMDVLPTKEPIKPIAVPLFQAVSELFINNYAAIVDWSNPKPERSDFVAPDFRPDDIWIGHSYFITKEDGAKGKEELRLKLKYEIVPILKEYLKDGLLIDANDERVIDKIKKLYDAIPKTV